METDVHAWVKTVLAYIHIVEDYQIYKQIKDVFYLSQEEGWLGG